jgi:hypothetical protein
MNQNRKMNDSHFIPTIQLVMKDQMEVNTLQIRLKVVVLARDK